MDPKIVKLVRTTTVIATATVSYFLLTADYGPQPNFLDPIKNLILSTEQSVKEFIFGGRNKETPQSEIGKAPPTAADKPP
ncbi:hypothetical protein ACS0TY_002454 [Phlomoides rotata]